MTTRPRLSDTNAERLKEHADEQNKTATEMCNDIIEAYHTQQLSNDTLEANNALLEEIHGALNLDAQPTLESSSTDEIENENLSNNDINYNALPLHHDTEIPRDSEDWAELWQNNVIKHRPQYLIPVVQGILNDMYDGDARPNTGILRKNILPSMGLSEHSVTNYVYKYGPEYDAWYPGILSDPKFNRKSIYTEAIEKLTEHQYGKSRKSRNFLREKNKDNHSDFKDMFDLKFKLEDGETESIWEGAHQLAYSQDEADEKLLKVLEGVHNKVKENETVINMVLLHHIVRFCEERNYLTDTQPLVQARVTLNTQTLVSF